jgi:hypothetical protein
VRLVAAGLLVSILCAGAACRRSSDAGPAAAAAQRPASPQQTHLRINGTSFLNADGSPFEWRGITALRLLDHLADGRTADVEAFLNWARSQKLTVVRTLAMGGGWMNLKPAEGRTALPRLLSLARDRGLHVEVVALAGTLDMPVNLEEQLATIGQVAGEFPNALVELANEPSHPTQVPAVGRADVLARLARRVPADVPVSFGSVEANPAYGRGDYVTWHAPRTTGPDGWRHVLALAAGAELLARANKPVVSDEPIGAAAQLVAGRRDNAPPRFRAAGLITRLVGMGATFHYEGGLEATVPAGVELECFNAWNEAWSLLPHGVETTGTFAAAGGPGAVVTGFDQARSRAVFERHTAVDGWVVAVGEAEPVLTLAQGWEDAERRTWPGVQLVTIRNRR